MSEAKGQIVELMRLVDDYMGICSQEDVSATITGISQRRGNRGSDIARAKVQEFASGIHGAVASAVRAQCIEAVKSAYDAGTTKLEFYEATIAAI